MSVANIGKLQENTTTLCKIGCDTLRVSAIRGSRYVYLEKLKCPPLPSGVRIPNVRHLDGMVVAAGWNSYPGGMWQQPDVLAARPIFGCDTSGWKVAAAGWNGGDSWMEFLPGWNLAAVRWNSILFVF